MDGVEQTNESWRILIVEDDERLADLTREYLESNGLTVSLETHGGAAVERIRNEQPDLVVLDLMLPGEDGLSICRRVRPYYSGPIIMLTARTDDLDQVLGLEMGADDYVTKPFSPLTLMARIKAVTRRFRAESGTDEHHYVASDYFKISKESREAYYNGQLLKNLTPKEFDLLYYLVKHPKQVFTREQLLDSVWGYQFYGDERTVDVHIKRLRKKIGTDEQPFIHTVWGVGYKFDETAAENEG